LAGTCGLRLLEVCAYRVIEMTGASEPLLRFRSRLARHQPELPNRPVIWEPRARFPAAFQCPSMPVMLSRTMTTMGTPSNQRKMLFMFFDS
jgi:hypothetical protein